ncbi:NAD(P)H-hydrate epimerase [Leisingera caerulea]|uniref:NAD(P)H-hydrate epimerase n=1 Tax=Leisingera caerulea TaxID=506591 RepID=UPI0035CCCCAE
MTELLTAAQMRAIEQAAIASGEVTGLELMERAGQGVLEAIFDEWPELAEERGASPSRSPEYLGKDEKLRRAVVLCGPGNNGGDGFVVARLLKERGWAVEVFLYGDPDKLPADAKVNYQRWRELGGVCDLLSCREIKLLGGHNKKTRVWSEKPLQQWQGAMLIDALFGTGVSRPMDEELREVIRDIELQSGAEKRVAIDMPSGLHSDTGVFVDFAPCELNEMWEAVEFVPIEADLTVTFHLPKRGQFMRDGVEACGKLVVKSIGL